MASHATTGHGSGDEPPHIPITVPPDPHEGRLDPRMAPAVYAARTLMSALDATPLDAYRAPVGDLGETLRVFLHFHDPAHETGPALGWRHPIKLDERKD